MKPTNVVDWGSDDPEVNLYGCRPCPKCGERYRYVFGPKEAREILCDDCGFKEPVAEWIER